MPAGASVGGRYGGRHSGLLPIFNVHPNALGHNASGAQVSVAPKPDSWALRTPGLLAVAVKDVHRHVKQAKQIGPADVHWVDWTARPGRLPMRSAEPLLSATAVQVAMRPGARIVRRNPW